MKLSIKQLAVLVEGKLETESKAEITGAAGLEDAKPTDVTFLGNAKYAALAARTRAGALIVPDNFKGEPAPGACVIRVKNPQLAFAKVLVEIDKERLSGFKPGIHASSSVSPKAKLGLNVSVAAFAVIEDGARIGDNTVISAGCFIGTNCQIGAGGLIYPNVTIRENVVIGTNAVIHSGTVIGSDGFGFVTLGTSNFKIPQIGTVTIGDDVEIGANCAIDRATTGATKIGNGTKLDNLVHIAHNIQIGSNCCIAGQAGFAGSSKVGDNVMIAGQAGINGHISIGNGVIIGGKAVVISDVPDNTMISGYPARPHHESMRIMAITGRLPELYEDIKAIKKRLAEKERK